MSDFGRALAIAGLLGVVACSVKSLPPGTPPPEYERRSFEPWPAGAADAGDAGSDAEVVSEPPPTVSPAPSADAPGEIPDASVAP
jgi:hypothetical protein